MNGKRINRKSGNSKWLYLRSNHRRCRHRTCLCFAPLWRSFTKSCNLNTWIWRRRTLDICHLTWTQVLVSWCFLRSRFEIVSCIRRMLFSHGERDLFKIFLSELFTFVFVSCFWFGLEELFKCELRNVECYIFGSVQNMIISPASRSIFNRILRLHSHDATSLNLIDIV